MIKCITTHCKLVIPRAHIHNQGFTDYDLHFVASFNLIKSWRCTAAYDRLGLTVRLLETINTGRAISQMSVADVGNAISANRRLKNKHMGLVSASCSSTLGSRASFCCDAITLTQSCAQQVARTGFRRDAGLPSHDCNISKTCIVIILPAFFPTLRQCPVPYVSTYLRSFSSSSAAQAPFRTSSLDLDSLVIFENVADKTPVDIVHYSFSSCNHFPELVRRDR